MIHLYDTLNDSFFLHRTEKINSAWNFYKFKNKQIGWRYTGDIFFRSSITGFCGYGGNAFLGFQQRYFWQNSTFTFFCWKWQWTIIIICCQFQFRTQPVFTRNISKVFNDVLKVLPKIDIVLLFLSTRKLKAVFQRGNWNYNTILVLQCKIMQHSTGGTIQYWRRTQFQILVKLLKWYTQTFLVKMVGILITQTQKIDDHK